VDPQELLLTALRAAAVYTLVLAVLRLTGKRSVGNFSAFDLLVALMLGEVVDEMIYGDVTLLQGGIAIVTIAVMKSLTSWLAYWDHGWNAILEGKPTLIIRHGEFQRDGLRHERMNEQEALAALRLAGIEDMSEVRLAYVEPDGEVSIIRERWAEPAKKGDIANWPRRQKEPSGRKTLPPQIAS